MINMVQSLFIHTVSDLEYSYFTRWPASSWFNSLLETDTKDWSVFSTNFLKEFHNANIKLGTQTEAQNIQLDAHESISNYACRVEVTDDCFS